MSSRHLWASELPWSHGGLAVISVLGPGILQHCWSVQGLCLECAACPVLLGALPDPP